MDEYIYDSTVGSDSEAPATSRMAPSSVAAARHTRQTPGKIPASHAVTQLAEAKKRRGKQTSSAVSADTTSKSSDIETIDVEEDEGDVKSLRATTAPSPGRRAAETPRPTLRAQGLSTSSTGCRRFNLSTSAGGTRSKVEGEDHHDLEPEGLRKDTRHEIYTGSGSRSSYPTSCLE
jgi:hypothetical protein